MDEETRKNFKLSQCCYLLDDCLNRNLYDIGLDIENFELALKLSEQGIKNLDSEEIEYIQTIIPDIYARMDDINKELKDISLIVDKIKINNEKRNKNE